MHLGVYPCKEGLWSFFTFEKAAKTKEIGEIAQEIFY